MCFNQSFGLDLFIDFDINKMITTYEIDCFMTHFIIYHYCMQNTVEIITGLDQ